MGDANAVYISFNRYEDAIRHSFLSHLAADFKRRGITLKEPASDHAQIPETCDAAIAKSKVFLVILSEEYASSECCLDELVKIFKCRENNGALVTVPVFYGLTKSGVRKHCLKLKKTYPDILVAERRDALLKLGDLPGHASSPEIR